MLHGKKYLGEARPVSPTCRDGVCFELDVTLNGASLGLIHYTGQEGWRLDHEENAELTAAIGNEIFLWYE